MYKNCGSSHQTKPYPKLRSYWYLTASGKENLTSLQPSDTRSIHHIPKHVPYSEVAKNTNWTRWESKEEKRRRGGHKVTGQGGGEDIKVSGQRAGEYLAGRSSRRRMNMIYCVKFPNKYTIKKNKTGL